MAVPYTTREMAKKIAEEVVKEHGGGGGGSSYTAGNGIRIENNEIEVDNTVVATLDSGAIGSPVITNASGLMVSDPTEETANFGAFLIGAEEGSVSPMPMMMATNGMDSMSLLLNATPGGFSCGPIFAQMLNTEHYDVYSDIPVMEFTIVTFIQTSNGVECPLDESNRKNLFKRIQNQVERGLYQFPTCQLMRVQELETGKVVQGMTSTIKISYNEVEPNKVLFEFSEEGAYELFSDGRWLRSEE